MMGAGQQQTRASAFLPYGYSGANNNAPLPAPDIPGINPANYAGGNLSVTAGGSGPTVETNGRNYSAPAGGYPLPGDGSSDPYSPSNNKPQGFDWGNLLANGVGAATGAGPLAGLAFRGLRSLYHYYNGTLNTEGNNEANAFAQTDANMRGNSPYSRNQIPPNDAPPMDRPTDAGYYPQYAQYGGVWSTPNNPNIGQPIPDQGSWMYGGSPTGVPNNSIVGMINGRPIVKDKYGNIGQLGGGNFGANMYNAAATSSGDRGFGTNTYTTASGYTADHPDMGNHWMPGVPGMSDEQAQAFVNSGGGGGGIASWGQPAGFRAK